MGSKVGWRGALPNSGREREESQGAAVMGAPRWTSGQSAPSKCKPAWVLRRGAGRGRGTRPPAGVLAPPGAWLAHTWQEALGEALGMDMGTRQRVGREGGPSSGSGGQEGRERRWESRGCRWVSLCRPWGWGDRGLSTMAPAECGPPKDASPSHHGLRAPPPPAHNPLSLSLLSPSAPLPRHSWRVSWSPWTTPPRPAPQRYLPSIIFHGR